MQVDKGLVVSWPCGLVKFLAPLLFKFVNQASMAATQLWLFSGLYLPLNG